MSFAPRKEKGIAICPKVTNEYLAEMKELDRIANEKANPVQVPFPTGTTSLNPPVEQYNFLMLCYFKLIFFYPNVPVPLFFEKCRISYQYRVPYQHPCNTGGLSLVVCVKVLYTNRLCSSNSKT
jgi:hypothetical protein